MTGLLSDRPQLARPPTCPYFLRKKLIAAGFLRKRDTGNTGSTVIRSIRFMVWPFQGCLDHCSARGAYAICRLTGQIGLSIIKYWCQPLILGYQVQ